jgi:hypothetical protein
MQNPKKIVTLYLTQVLSILHIKVIFDLIVLINIKKILIINNLLTSKRGDELQVFLDEIRYYFVQVSTNEVIVYDIH